MIAKRHKVEFQRGDKVAHLMIVGRNATGHWIAEPRVHLADAERECLRAMNKDPATTAFIHNVSAYNGPQPQGSEHE